MIEDQMKSLEEALRENTAALRAVLEASKADVKVVHTITPAPETKAAKTKAVKPTPEPVIIPEETETTTEETPAPDPGLTDIEPTKVPTPPSKADTPHVPAPVAPGQPEAGEHVDVDEVIGQIQSTLKKKMLAEGADAKAVQDAFVVIRKSYGVERINELKSEPAKLLDVLKRTQAL